MTKEEQQAAIAAIKDNMSRVIIGRSDVIDCVLTSLIAGGHVLIEDVPGTGKTMLAKSLARSIDASFSRIQFTPDLMPSDVTGLTFYNQKESEFTFREGPVFCHILLADEINRATPRTQSALLECMEEHQVTIDGTTHTLSSPFFVIATENPVETAGTFPLPEAQMDRFFMKLPMGLPDADEELAILNRFIDDTPLENLSPVCSIDTLLEIQASVPKIYVHPSLLNYMVDIVEQTRTDHNVINGVSPRGTLALLRASQSYALINVRDYVVPEDVKFVAVPVLAHRLIIASSATGSNGAEGIITRILDQVPVPTETAFAGKES